MRPEVGRCQVHVDLHLAVEETVMDVVPRGEHTEQGEAGLGPAMQGPVDGVEDERRDGEGHEPLDNPPNPVPDADIHQLIPAVTVRRGPKVATFVGPVYLAKVAVRHNLPLRALSMQLAFVIPAYNEQALVGKCVGSVLAEIKRSGRNGLA